METGLVDDALVSKSMKEVSHHFFSLLNQDETKDCDGVTMITESTNESDLFYNELCELEGFNETKEFSDLRIILWQRFNPESKVLEPQETLLPPVDNVVKDEDVLLEDNALNTLSEDVDLLLDDNPEIITVHDELSAPTEHNAPMDPPTDE